MNLKHRLYCLGLTSFVLLLSSNTFAASSMSLKDSLAEHSGISRAQASEEIQRVFKAIETELASGRDVQIRSFGTFYLQDREARSGRNPKSGQVISIPAKRYPRFRSSEVLKTKVNGGKI